MTYEAVITPDQTSGDSTARRSRRATGASEKPKTAAEASPWQRILARATQTFGNEESAAIWLNRPAAPLQNQTPKSLIASPKGFRQVEQLLGKIDHGIAV